ncbi:MAG: adenylate/guanylate cyclase domain-containing protein [Chloroflexi bacterium]|nr:adenylate/guanylate cyclase domain-containing protein [Chloroflexota bacterium]MCH8910698.1 adenylate/guanylate cyclase domain-containing protein [Chloroflexota bacterium]
MIFADVRGSTSIAENIGPTEFARLMNRFYEVAMKALLPQNAVIDKMIGDEVMAFFVPSFQKDSQAAAMVAATDILRGVGFGSGKQPWLPVGIGINFGEAYVGKVGTGDVNDFTALGDTVNTAARLQGRAKAGEIVVSENVYSHIASKYPDVPKQEIDLSGKSEPFGAHVISLAE